MLCVVCIICYTHIYAYVYTYICKYTHSTHTAAASDAAGRAEGKKKEETDHVTRLADEALAYSVVESESACEGCWELRDLEVAGIRRTSGRSAQLNENTKRDVVDEMATEKKKDGGKDGEKNGGGKEQRVLVVTLLKSTKGWTFQGSRDAIWCADVCRRMLTYADVC